MSSALTHYLAPGGQRDTYATARMRAELRPGLRPSSEGTWGRLPLASRRYLCTRALGIAGLDLCERGWREIPSRDRLRIVAEAQRLAAALV